MSGHSVGSRYLLPLDGVRGEEQTRAKQAQSLGKGKHTADMVRQRGVKEEESGCQSGRLEEADGGTAPGASRLEVGAYRVPVSLAG